MKNIGMLLDYDIIKFSNNLIVGSIVLDPLRASGC